MMNNKLEYPEILELTKLLKAMIQRYTW